MNQQEKLLAALNTAIDTLEIYTGIDLQTEYSYKMPDNRITKSLAGDTLKEILQILEQIQTT